MSRYRALFPVVILTLLGFALRLYQLDQVPLRGDEAFSALNWAALPISESLTSIARIEPHPPLTYILFHFWYLLFGIEHEFTLRLLPGLVNILGIPAIYAIGVLLTRKRQVGLIAALLWALHPYQIWHSQDFRNYAIWSGISLITIWLGLRTIIHQRSASWLAYLLAATIGCLTFYFESVTILIVTLFGLLINWQLPYFRWRWIISNMIPIGLGAAAFLFLQGQLVGSGAYGGTIANRDPLQLLTSFIPILTFGDTLPDPWPSIIWLPLLALLIIAWLQIRKQRLAAMFLCLLAIMPLAFLAIASLRLNIFHPRYILMASPAYILIFSAAITCSKTNTGWRLFIQGVLVVWLLVSLIAISHHFFDPTFRKSNDWPALAAYLSDNVQENDLVIQTSNDPGFGYYYDAPADDIALPESPQQGVDEIEATLTDASQEYDSLWVVARGFRDWPNAGSVENWANEHLQLTRRTLASELPIQQFKRWEIEDSEIAGQVLTQFGSTAELADARIFWPPESTGELTIWLYWRAIDQSDEALKLFVHLVPEDQEHQIVRQYDSFPQQGRISTTTWKPGTLYRDVLTLTLRELPQGTYHILMGLYAPETDTRLITATGSDHHQLGTITLNQTARPE